MASRSNSRDLILNAAEEIIRERGASAVTMDVLAYMTGVGKGGVLYHFKHKVDLYKAMLERHCSRLEEQLKEEESHSYDDADQWLDRYVEFCMRKKGIDMDSTISIIAAAAEKPNLLEPLRKTYARRHKRALAEMDDPELATIILLAIDGLTLFTAISAPPIDDSMREGLYHRMKQLIQEGSKKRD